MTRQVNPEMVRLARESRGITQKELADRVSLDQATISRLELGSATGTDESLRLIADALHYPVSFFFQDEHYSGLGMSVVFYRKRASTLVKHMRQIEAQINVRRIQADALMRDATLKLPNEFVPIDIDELHGDASAIAQMTRANWKMPPGPVKNLVAVIESAGGIVFRFPFGTREIDAISHWPDGSSCPMFFVNSEADADRARFSLAHELGHMVMHCRVSETMEDEANQFAAELLMPERDIRHDLYGMSLAKASNMKPFWRVSMAALLKRAHDHGCMNDFKYQSQFKLYSRLGYRRKEPNPIAHEEPRLIQKLVDAHIEQKGFTLQDFSRMLHLVEDEARENYFAPAKSGLRLVS